MSIPPEDPFARKVRQTGLAFAIAVVVMVWLFVGGALLSLARSAF